MRRHWQRKPLLIRRAFEQFEPPVPWDTLLELSTRDDVESRLVRRVRQRWTLQHGPFTPDALPTLRARNWSLLVQGVDLHDPAAHALLSRFRFIPDVRVDDLMISLAGDGGGVGPHVDSYDVFLLQAQGRRRWQIAPPASQSEAQRFMPGLPLKILQHFVPTQEWILESGDMLYLPPGWAHDGVAIGPCMTCSIGLRAPSRQEFLREWLSDSADSLRGPDPRHVDAGLEATRSPGAIPGALFDRLHGWARSFRPSQSAIDQFIGRFLTEPKATVTFDRPARLMALTAFRRQALRRGVALDRRSRMAYRGKQLFVNGEACQAPASAILKRLADFRSLTVSDLVNHPANDAFSGALWNSLHDWWAAGWLHFDNPQGRR